MMFSISSKFCIPMTLCAMQFVIALIMDPQSQTKPYPWESAFPYNSQALINYVIINISYIHLGFSVIMVWIAEDVFISVSMSYTYARYQMLSDEIDDLVWMVNDIHAFKRKLRGILRKQQMLQKSFDFVFDFLNYNSIFQVQSSH